MGDEEAVSKEKKIMFKQFKAVSLALFIALSAPAFAIDSNIAATETSESVQVALQEATTYPAWESNKVYTKGDRVEYNGHNWEAKWWTQREEPGKSQWGPWSDLGTAEPPKPEVVLIQANQPLIQTGGRIQYNLEGEAVFSWPGVHFEATFTGTTLGVRIPNSSSLYNVVIDGKEYPVLKPEAGKTDYIIASGLTAGTHTVRLSKRGETTNGQDLFSGFLIDAGETLLESAPKVKRIEFLGDSYTVGYGNESLSRECTDAEIVATTNHDKAFPALTAKHYGAEFNTQAYSGLGLVRNYNGNQTFHSYRTYEDLTIISDNQSIWNYAGQEPQVVVIGLGINDFSTPVRPEENYGTMDDFKVIYKAEYHKLLDKLRQRYPNAHFFLSATFLWPDDHMRPTVQQVVNEEKAQGFQNVHYFEYSAQGTGCQWHPGVQDHQGMSTTLINLIDGVNPW